MQDTRYHGSLTAFTRLDRIVVDAVFASRLGAMARVHEAGWTVINVDIVVATEGPRIAPHRAELRERIGSLLEIDPCAVNVKGKSLEGLGALAGGAGVAVQAVCLLGER